MPQAKHTQKPRKAWLAVQKPRIAQYTVLEPGGLGLVRGGGKCYGFTANWFTFLDRTDNGRAGNAGRMTGGADSAITPSGKVLRFHGKSIHFPWSEIGLSSLHLSYGILERSLPGKVGKSTLHDVGCQECPNIKPI